MKDMRNTSQGSKDVIIACALLTVLCVLVWMVLLFPRAAPFFEP